MKNNNLTLKIIIAVSLILSSCVINAKAVDEKEYVVLENFTKYNKMDDFFNNWLLRDDKKSQAIKIYDIISENNNKFLKVISSGNSIQIAKKIKWDITSFPVLSWKWRAIELPEKADESARGKNDSGAAIYVIFQRTRLPFLSWKYQPINVIKYVWSTSLRVGEVVKKTKTKLGNTIYEGRFIVIESGIANLDKWITEERNVLKDYTDVFGENPKYNPILIAILSDSNDTKSRAVADYDDFIIKKR